MGLFKQTAETSDVSGTSQNTDRTEKTIIAEGTECTGEFNVAGELHISGHLQGSILSESTVTIGLTGYILGEIQAEKIVVSGNIEGKVVCNTLEIMQNGSVKGEIGVGKLVIEPGGVFVGNSRKIDESSPKSLPKSEERPLLETSVEEAETENA